MGGRLCLLFLNLNFQYKESPLQLFNSFQKKKLNKTSIKSSTTATIIEQKRPWIDDDDEE